MGRYKKLKEDKKYGRVISIDYYVDGFFDYLKKTKGEFSPSVNDIIRRSKDFRDYFKQREKNDK
jgi:hypothetical protein